MADRKRPPRWQSKVAPHPGPVDGIDNLPIPIGVNMTAQKDAEQDSEATPGALGNPMTSADYKTECNGSNPKIADVSAFATGKDVRSFGASPKNDPTPSMPGANV